MRQRRKNSNVTTPENTAYVFNLTDFPFADPNDQPANTLKSVIITSLPGAGALALSGQAVTVGQAIAASDVVTGNLVFTPGVNGSGAKYATFGFAVEDDGGTANGGVDTSSSATMTIAVTAPLSVTITGTAQEGQTLTANPSGAVIGYQWQTLTGSTWTDISGATNSTYVVQEGDEGNQLRVHVTSNSGPADSAATSAVTDAAPSFATAVSISGTAQEGQTLTASATATEVDDAVTYQWFSSADNYTTALGSGSTYHVVEGDEGHTIRVVATVTNDNGATVTSSDTSAAVTDTAPSFATAVSISGTAQEGQTLTASATATEGDDAVTYQWFSSVDNYAAALGSGSTYHVVEGDEGHTIRGVATVTNDNGATVTSSDTSAAVTDIAPTLTTPVISGVAQEGQTLTASAAVANDTDAAVGYQWQADHGSGFVAITGASGLSYVVQPGDVGAQLRIVATSTDDDGSGTTATSAPTAAVTAASGLSVTITGTAQEGQTLTANPSDVVTGYQWQTLTGSTWTDISGATNSTYVVQEGDEGNQLRVHVTSNSGPADSAATSAVTDAAPSFATAVSISGTAQEGQTLTASATATEVDDAVTYQWFSSADNYTTALGSGSTYHVVEGDEGHTIRVIATVTNDNGATVTSSDTSAAVTDTAPSFATAVSISGTAQEGQTLTASATATEGDDAVTYQWFSSVDNYAAALGSGSTYHVVEGDEGHTIRGVATVTNDNGATVTSSDTSAAVTDIAPTLTTPVISGVAQEGQTLTASAAVANDTDAVVSYQWQALVGSTWTNLSGNGATTLSYTVQEADEGHQLRIVATSTDSDGSGTLATSASTAAVTDIAPSFATAVSISGTAQEGQTLTASAAATEGDDPVTYQWFSSVDNYAAAIGSGSTYHVVEGDEGHTIRVVATVTNDNGATVTSSDTSAAVTDIAPTLTTPVISGVAQEGQTLTATAAVANDTDAVVSYQWQALVGSTWTNLSGNGATTLSYTVQEADEGHQLRIVATSTDSDGSGTLATSASTAAVTDIAPTLAVTIVGIPQDGQTLTAVAIANDSDAVVSYQWQTLTQQGWKNIKGATSANYVVQESDEGNNLRVIATSSDSDGAGTSAISGATAAVVDPPPTLTILQPSLFVAAGGSVPLGISVSGFDADDKVSVTITGLASYETIIVGHKTFSGASVTLTAAQVNSGLTLQSTYTGTGRPVNTLSVTAANLKTGEEATSSVQSITITDPPIGSTTVALNNTAYVILAEPVIPAGPQIVDLKVRPLDSVPAPTVLWSNPHITPNSNPTNGMAIVPTVGDPRNTNSANITVTVAARVTPDDLSRSPAFAQNEATAHNRNRTGNAAGFIAGEMPVVQLAHGQTVTLGKTWFNNDAQMTTLIGPLPTKHDLAKALFIGGVVMPNRAVDRGKTTGLSERTSHHHRRSQIVTYNLCGDRFEGIRDELAVDLPPPLETNGEGVEWTIVQHT